MNSLSVLLNLTFLNAGLEYEEKCTTCAFLVVLQSPEMTVRKVFNSVLEGRNLGFRGLT